LRHILRMVVNMLNDDGPLGEQEDLGHQAQASADQAHTTWPLAPPGAPMPTDFVAGQAPAETGIGQSQGNTRFQAFADFGGGIPVGNGNVGFVDSSSGAILGSSGNDVETRPAAYSGGVPPQTPSVPGYYAPLAGSSQNASVNAAMSVLTLLRHTGMIHYPGGAMRSGRRSTQFIKQDSLTRRCLTC
jgi:hypothetical protein